MNPRDDMVALLLVGLAIGLYLFLPFFLLYRSHKNNRFRRLLEGLPTSKANGVFIGLVEVKGTAETDAPLTSYLAELPCVWYDYTVEEQWRRVVTETYTDSQGKTQTRTRVEQGWRTVDSGGLMQDFFLHDDTGFLLIKPAGADVEGDTSMKITCGEDSPLYYGKGPQGSISNSTYTRRFTEKIVPHQRLIYVIGTAREREDIVAPEIASGKKGEHFLISTRKEEEIVRSHVWKAWLQALGGLLILAGVPLALELADSGFTPFRVGPLPLSVLAGIAYLLIWLLSWCWSIYNSLIDLRNRVTQGMSQVDIQLQRRHDLIPRLTEAVAAYTRHEALTQEKITSLRTSLENLSNGTASMRLLQEAYPDLVAQPLFSELSRELANTEDRIALAREYFNSIANHYNTRIQVYPEAILAYLFRLTPKIALHKDRVIR